MFQLSSEFVDSAKPVSKYIKTCTRSIVFVLLKLYLDISVIFNINLLLRSTVCRGLKSVCRLVNVQCIDLSYLFLNYGNATRRIGF